MPRLRFRSSCRRPGRRSVHLARIGAVLLFTLAAFASAQPLLFIGKADAELSGAFSYDFLRSPLGRPTDKSLAQISLNLPVNASSQAQR
ncbi:MAG TPA: hypothetical protein VK465_14580, partial [Fibrobacteria bacterium]|nr:hypothetical protein [Fibrobacteria bacterium]